MATTVTTVKTVDITLTDSQGYDTTYKINNPKSNITLEEIQTAYQPMFEGQYLYSKSGNHYTAIVRAIINEVRTTKEALEAQE